MRPTLTALALLAGSAVAVAADDPARTVSALIDKHLDADWTARGIKPAPAADDEEFCRRVYLDLIGRIPKVAEVREFAESADPDKRRKLVDKLLSKPGYASHFASLTRAAWLPETISDQFRGFLGQQYEDYLRRKLAANVPLDKIVAETLTADVAVGPRGRAFNSPTTDPDQQAFAAFYQALEAKPENLGATASRAFLGVKLECAQCHDHPFAPYSRDQFWQFAAFFGEYTPLPPVGPSFVGPLQPQYTKNRIAVGGTSRQVTARFMDGAAPVWTDRKSPRQELADWVVAADNPYFAKNLVNRVWHQMFGVGLIDPVDEPGDGNPPSHPELLDELAAAFARGGYDLHVLLRGVAGSRAYQLTSRLTHPTQGDPRRFARMNMKGLTGGQIFDSFVTATGVRPTALPVNRFTYQTLFPIPAKPTDTQTSILQALTVMNGRLVADQTNVEKADALAAVADAPFLTTEKKVEALFLAALTRKPTPEEKDTFGSYVDRGGPSGDKSKALADVFWVLLNSTEFLFNH